MRFIAQTVLTLLANATGIILATLLLPGFSVNLLGFITSVAFFTVFELLFEPFVLKMAVRYLPALRGGIALVTTFVGLFLTNIFTSGVEIQGLATWLLAPAIVWLTVVVMGVVLPMFLFKNTIRNAKNNLPTRERP